MNSKILINELSQDLRPVKVIKYGLKDYILIFSTAFFSVLASLAISGLRFDINEALLSARFVTESLTLFALAILSTISALYVSIPNLKSLRAKNIVITNLIFWFAFLLYFLANSEKPIAGWGFACAREVALNSIAPAIVIFFTIRKGATLDRITGGWLILTSAAAFGALATQFSCPSTDPLHVLVWHAVPVVLIGIVGIGLGKLIIKKV